MSADYGHLPIPQSVAYFSDKLELAWCKGTPVEWPEVTEHCRDIHVLQAQLGTQDVPEARLCKFRRRSCYIIKVMECFIVYVKLT